MARSPDWCLADWITARNLDPMRPNLFLLIEIESVIITDINSPITGNDREMVCWNMEHTMGKHTIN